MAEVRIQLEADDRVTPVLQAVLRNAKGVFSEMNASMQGEARAFQANWSGVLGLIATIVAAVAAAIQVVDDSIGDLRETVKSIEEELTEGIEFKVDAGAASEAVKSITDEVEKLITTKTLSLDVADALEGARQVREAIDAIPDVTYKDVVVRYQTQASPVMPFSEGMDYIERRMAALPAGGTYTLRPDVAPLGGGNVTLSPTININGVEGREGRSLARDVDLALADMWRTNRSELRRAMNA